MWFTPMKPRLLRRYTVPPELRVRIPLASEPTCQQKVGGRLYEPVYFLETRLRPGAMPTGVSHRPITFLERQAAS